MYSATTVCNEEITISTYYEVSQTVYISIGHDLQQRYRVLTCSNKLQVQSRVQKGEETVKLCIPAYTVCKVMRHACDINNIVKLYLLVKIMWVLGKDKGL